MYAAYTQTTVHVLQREVLLKNTVVNPFTWPSIMHVRHLLQCQTEDEDQCSAYIAILFKVMLNV